MVVGPALAPEMGHRISDGLHQRLLIWVVFAEFEAFQALEHLNDSPWRRTVISSAILSMLAATLWAGLEVALSRRSGTERAQGEEDSQR